MDLLGAQLIGVTVNCYVLRGRPRGEMSVDELVSSITTIRHALSTLYRGPRSSYLTSIDPQPLRPEATKEATMTISTNSSTAVAGRLLPAPGRWTIDPLHSRVGFTVRHAAIATVHGSFPDVSGYIDVADDLQESTVRATIQAASFTTAVPVRDADVRGPDWLDAAQYPTLQFTSTGLDLDGPQGFLHGDLTIRGITRSVTLALEYAGTSLIPPGERRAGFNAATRIDRRDFGVVRNMPLPTGGFFVAYDIGITLDVEAVAPSP